MDGLSNETLAELQKMTKDQLIAHILEGQTYSDVGLVKDEDGNNVELTEVTKDALTGNLVSSKTVRWTYYPGGEVDEITVQEANRQEIIKHYLDGRQPNIVLKESSIILDIVEAVKAAITPPTIPKTVMPIAEPIEPVEPVVVPIEVEGLAMDTEPPLTLREAFVADIKGAGQLFVEDLKKLGKSAKKLMTW